MPTKYKETRTVTTRGGVSTQYKVSLAADGASLPEGAEPVGDDVVVTAGWVTEHAPPAPAQSNG